MNRLQAQRRWRAKRQAEDPARRPDTVATTTSGHVILSPEHASALATAMSRWLSAIAEAAESIRLAASDLTPAKQRTFARAAEHLMAEVSVPLQHWISSIDPGRDHQ